MPRSRSLSPQSASVLRALVADPATWRYGYELGREVGLKAGSLYPILIRLAERELLESRWEEQSEASGGRPPRHLYRLTGAGRELGAQLAPVPARAPAAGRPRRELRSA
ncbi:MAG TPA: helix-turn-helix transcriptional regulator [Gaiellales bacterium]|nr:helix-turn-helix transcriptional regulator [Gaiellales bacterium]